MSDNEKLIKLIDMLIHCYNTGDEVLNLDLASLKEIKGIVEKAGKFPPHIKKVVIMSSPEPQPQPDEELAEKIVRAVVDNTYSSVHGLDRDGAKAEIRKLLEGTK